MSHAARFKVKIGGKWLDSERVSEARDQSLRRDEAPPAPVDVASLPPKESLDPDVPLAQLVLENREVALLLTPKGRIRTGLTKNQQQQAQAILDKYGGNHE